MNQKELGRQEKRIAAIVCYENGKKPRQIAEFTGIPERTVYKTVNRWKETGDWEDRKRSGRPATACTPENINKVGYFDFLRSFDSSLKVRCKIRRNPERSMREIGRELKIDKNTVRKIVKKLRKRSYRIGHGQLLSADNKQSRLEKAAKLRRLVAGDKLNTVVFTDEKRFLVTRPRNSQNTRQILASKKSPAYRRIQRTMKPAGVMVWAGVCVTGKTKLVFIDKGVEVNSANYQQMLTEKFLPWARKHFKKRRYTFQQDWTPSHGSFRDPETSTLAYCKRTFKRFWWRDIYPAASPDLNPLDYSIWAILEKKVGKKSYRSVEKLKKALTKAWKAIPQEHIRAAIEQFPRRIEACIEARKGYFENLL